MFGEHPDFNDIDPRCAYVHRHVLANGAYVNIFTHGEGHNPGAAQVVFNEKAGEAIFRGVDQWIRERLATDGICTDDP